MHRSQRCLKAKNQNQQRSRSHATNQQITAFPSRPSRRDTRRVGRARKGGTATAGFPRTPRSWRLGRPVRRRPQRKPTQSGTRVPALEQLPHMRRRHEGLGHHRSGPFCYHDSLTRRVLMHPKSNKKEKSTMTTAAATHAMEVIPNTVSLVQDIPLSRIQESKTNQRRQFDESRLAELADNIRLHGVLQPILVRPLPGGEADSYELVAGARRYRASKLAKCEC